MDNRKHNKQHSPSYSQSQTDLDYDDEILIKETSYDYVIEQNCEEKEFRGSENGKRDFDDVDYYPSVLDNRTSLASITNAGASLISRRFYPRHKKMKTSKHMEGLDIPVKNLWESPQQSFDTHYSSDNNAFADLESLLIAQKEGYPENDSGDIYDSEGRSWDIDDVESIRNFNSITDLNIPTTSLAPLSGSNRNSAEQVSEVASNLTHQPLDRINAWKQPKSIDENGLTRETRGSFKSGDFTSQTTTYFDSSNCVAGLIENPMPSIRNHKVSHKVRVTPVAKSIVGSRPFHWCKRDKIASSSTLSQPHGTRISNKRDRKSQLAKAVCGSFPALHSRKDSFGMPPPPNRIRSNSLAGGSQLVISGVTKGSLVTPQRNTGRNNKNFEPARLTRSISNAMTRQSSLTETDDMSLIADDDDNDSCARRVNMSQAIHLPSTNFVRDLLSASPQRENQATNHATEMLRVDLDANKLKQIQSKSKLGPLGKRLKYLRDSIKGDCLRFQSGQYPFAAKSKYIGGSSRDGGDPRSRVSNHCDVTIVSPVISFEKESDGGITAALAYVHCFKLNELKMSAVEHIPINVANKHGFVWILFSHKTVIEQKLAVRSELRIYNAIWIPQVKPNLLLTVPAASYLKTAELNATVNWLVACTQLCEPYPSGVLPPLPVVHDVVALESTIQNESSSG